MGDLSTQAVHIRLAGLPLSPRSSVERENAGRDDHNGAAANETKNCGIEFRSGRNEVAACRLVGGVLDNRAVEVDAGTLMALIETVHVLRSLVGSRNGNPGHLGRPRRSEDVFAVRQIEVSPKGGKERHRSSEANRQRIRHNLVNTHSKRLQGVRRPGAEPMGHGDDIAGRVVGRHGGAHVVGELLGHRPTGILICGERNHRVAAFARAGPAAQMRSHGARRRPPAGPGEITRDPAGSGLACAARPPRYCGGTMRPDAMTSPRTRRRTQARPLPTW